MKNALLISLFFFSPYVEANACKEALTEFQDYSQNILKQATISLRELNDYDDSFIKLKIMTEDEPCYRKTLASSKILREEVRKKRILSIAQLFKNKQFEESGSDLTVEYAILTGARKGVAVGSADLFEDILDMPLKNPKGALDIKTALEQRRSTYYERNKQTGCTNIINQNEAVNFNNTRNQDGVGWCYAYTAADLLSFRLNKPVSAVSLYSSSMKKSIEENVSGLDDSGGDIGEAITEFLKNNKGLCLEKDLPSSDFKFCAFKDYAQFLNALYKSVNEGSLQDNQCLRQNLNTTFPGVSAELINHYAENRGSKKLVEYLYAKTCRNKIIPDKAITPVTKSKISYGDEALLKEMDGLLTRGEVVGLAYNYDYITEESGETKGHASLVVGRRLNEETGECEYLIRNSWGKDCAQNEGSGLSCHKQCDGEGENCRYSGHFWASSRRIKNSILGITYLP